MSRFGAAVYRVDQRIPGIDLPLLSVSQTMGVIRRSELTDRPARAESLDVYKVCRKGDIVFNKMSIRSGAMGVAQEDGLVTYHYEVMRVRPRFDPRYLVYLMKSDYFTGEMIKRERGIGAGDQVGVRTTEVPFRILRTIECSLPDSEKQVAIADYLTRETAKIDALIDKQLGMIGLLRERRQAVLDETFADGSKVHPVRLRRLLVSRPSYGVLVPQYVSETDENRVPLIRVGDLTTLCTESELPFISTEQSTEYSRTRLIGGEVLLGVVGKMGQSTIAPRDLAGSNVARAVAVLRCTGSEAAALLNVWFASTEFLNQATLATGGDTIQPTLGMADLARMVVSWPDDEGVMRTLDRIRERLTSIDQAIGQAGRMVELAQARRSALITAAVTGQLDISGEAA